MAKMNVEIGRKWVESLRSGEYEQTRGNLRDSLRTDGNGYCCLGVLCELYRAAEGGEWQGGIFRSPGGDVNSAVLPLAVAEWAGFGLISDPMAGGYSLATYNDGQEDYYDEEVDVQMYSVPPKSFNEIADLIEQYLLSDDDE